MKSKKKIRKLEFTKETIAMLGADQMRGMVGGHPTITLNRSTCTCITNASVREPCNE